jgi:hydroxymethylbilane synthase
MWQAEWVESQLAKHGYPVEIVRISTQGDTSTASLREVGGQGIFTKEIQNALLDNRVDVAVHSLKDLPTEPIPGLTIAAVPERESTLDCLISASKARFKDLPAGARVGTGSSRRGAQLLAWRPDIEIIDIRGNVDSRIRKLEEGKYDAIILAAAGLQRLQLYSIVSEELPQDRVLPAIGQGALGLECREDDQQATTALKMLDHVASHQTAMAERSLLRHLSAGCMAPVAARATVVGEELKMEARVLATDGSQVVEGTCSGARENFERLGEELAKDLWEHGGEALIAAARKIHDD